MRVRSPQRVRIPPRQMNDLRGSLVPGVVVMIAVVVLIVFFVLPCPH